jgi:hypothetical protein
MPWSIVADVALLDDQKSRVRPPPTGSVSGMAVNAPLGGGGGRTTTVFSYCFTPPTPEMVMVNVVVESS